MDKNISSMPPENFVSTGGRSPTSGPDDQAGRMLGGKYQIIDLLGRGGIGAVYRVRQVFLNIDMALKLLDSDKAADTSQIRRFEQEAKAAYALNHPGLVKVHDFGLLETGQPYLVMDLVEGETLAAYLKRAGALSPVDINAIFSQVCFALSYAHSEKVVHRDIKPSNIMLIRGMSRDTEGSVKVIDFGLAKWLTEGEAMQGLTRTGEVMGSPIYMSPEQCSGGSLDHRSDIYSLGCVLFEALTGTPPFIGETSLRTMMLHQTGTAPTLREASLGRQFPPALEDMVAKMLAKSPADRYQDLGVVGHELAFVCLGSDRAIEPKRMRPIDEPTQKLKRKKPGRSFTFTPWQLALMNGCTAICIALAAVLVVQSGWVRIGQPATSTQPVPDLAFSYNYKETLPDANNKLPAELRNGSGKPLVSEIVKGPDGKDIRQFQFPDISIGTVTDRWRDNKLWSKSQVTQWNAKSKADFPVDLPLTLEIDVSRHPELMDLLPVYKRIGPNEFSCLALIKDDALDETVDKEHRFLTDIVQQAATWKHLQALVLESLDLGPKEVEAIDSLPPLKVLSLNRTAASPGAFNHSSFLHNVVVCLCVMEDASIISSRLDGSTRLTTVSFRHCNCMPGTFHDLKSCPNLRIVQAVQTDLADHTVKAIADLHQVRTVIANNLTAPQVKILLAAPNLVQVIVDSKTQELAARNGITDRRLIGDEQRVEFDP
jgi:serine/threonine protein kinase